MTLTLILALTLTFHPNPCRDHDPHSHPTLTLTLSLNHEVAPGPKQVGAGDTFIAALLFALSRGATPAQALRCGCAVAGRKVAQRGFGGLADAVPPEVQRLATGTA